MLNVTRTLLQFGIKRTIGPIARKGNELKLSSDIKCVKEDMLVTDQTLKELATLDLE